MASYKIQVKKSAAKEINALPRRDAARVVDKIAALAEEPRPSGCKKLSGEEKYRIRSGDYRILYKIEDAIVTVYIVKVGHRKDIYQ